MRPIMDDARVIASKIAHDPGRIGVKGALDRRQSGSKHLMSGFGGSFGSGSASSHSGPPAVIYYEDVQP